MSAYSDELRLLLVLLLNGGVFAGAYCFARHRGGSGRLQAVCDAFLIYFLVEYVSVALPGALGVYTLASMSLVAIAAAAGLWFAAGKSNPNSSEELTWDSDHLGLLACSLFLIGFVAAYSYIGRWVPPMATDSIVYHLPTVIQWMQTDRLGIYPTWYWNPAASYSPATGMTFMAWLMAPAGSDVFVRYVQVPALLFIYFLTVRFCRLMGCSRTAAGLLAVAAVLSRSLFSEVLFCKDDLFITAFVAAAVLSLGRDQLQDRLGPWRAGIALGLVLASKYTVLLVCPVFLFMIDAPFRARWRVRHWLIAIAIVLAMAAPWYVRNILLTGNPLYPVDVKFLGIHFPGLFATERDQQLRTTGGVWRMFTQTYHSLPRAVIGLLLVGWIAAMVAGRRQVLRDPLRRACLVGSVLTLAIFLITSPHHEVRYMFPLFVLWFADFAIALSGWIKSAAGQAIVALIAALISTGTIFETGLLRGTAILASVGLAVAGAGVGLLLLQLRVLRLNRNALAGIVSLALMAASLYTYVNWHGYVTDYLSSRVEVWNDPQANYSELAPAWRFVEEQLPQNAIVAYANTYFVYPLYDPTYRHRVGYAPVRRGLHDFLRLPPLGGRVPGDLIFAAMASDMNADPDMATWIQNLRQIGANYLLIDRKEIVPDPPELTFARQNPELFHPVFEDPRTVVFELRWEHH